MATYTAVAGGGNWNSNSTWTSSDGGTTFPTTGDTAILNATSGQVTVTANATCLILNCVGYANTLTINTGFILTVTGTGATISLGGTISTLQQGELSTAGTPGSSTTINFNGITIPSLRVGCTAGGLPCTTVIGTGATPTVQNLIIVVSNGSASISGAQLTVTTSITATGGGLSGTSGGSLLISGNCSVSTTSNGFLNISITVPNLSTLTLSSTLFSFGNTLGSTPTLTFNAGSSLVTNNNTLNIVGQGSILNTSNVTWYDVQVNGASSQTTTLTSNLNISRNLSVIALTHGFTSGASFFDVNVGGGLSIATGITFTITNTDVILNGTGGGGTIDGGAIQGNGLLTSKISITGNNYVIGTPSKLSLGINTTTFELSGATAAATVVAGHTLAINGGLTLTTNNTATGANIGGNQIIWNNITQSVNTTVTITYDTTTTGNLSNTSGNTATFNTGKISFGGNLSTPGSGISGTSTLEFIGTNNATWGAGTYQNNVTVNKSGGAIVTITGAVSWGTTNRTLLVSTGTGLALSANLTITAGTMTFLGTATLNPGTSTLLLTGTGTKILNTSTVNWYDVNNNTQTTLVVLSSSLNISNNLNFANTAGSAGCGFSGSSNTFVSGSLIATDGGTPSITYPGGGSINMVGTGTIESTNVMSFTLNINTPNPSGYVFGSVARPTYFLGNPGIINLVTSSIATVFSSSHNLNLRAGSTVNTNNTPTGANLPGGTQILWGNITSTVTGTQTTTISQPIIAQGNLTATTVGVIFVVNGAKVTVGGNLNCINLQGTSEIELGQNTNGTWSAGTYQNNITVNKSSPGSLTLSGAITWGLANRILTRTAGSINPSTSTISIPASTNVTINDMTLWNLTIPGASTTTHNVSNTIQNDLTLAATGNTTFTGSAGWTCANLLCSTAGRIITLANSSSGASYRTTTNANLLGTAASPVSMSSNNATTRSLWTLDNGAAQSLVYVNGTRIDSSQGATIWSFGGVLTNTVNWGSGSAPATTTYTYVC
jgi:hypothetical protein